ncbi:MAG: hypothetical protein O2815_10880, partial [Actinomycetota bacterium]|nr:hypothetical protein [Actinomycetota bacterium]
AAPTTTAPALMSCPIPGQRICYPHPMVDNGYVTDAGVYRSFPTYDQRCSEDATIRLWFRYADGFVAVETWTARGGGEGYFTDQYGTEVPHPIDVARYPDGSMECMFIYGQ